MVDSEDIPVDADLGSGPSPPRSGKKSKGTKRSVKKKEPKRKSQKKVKATKKAKKAKKAIKYDPTENFMVPKHEIVSESEKEELIRRYGSLDLFPKILVTDPIVERIGAKEGDVIRTYREEGFYYRYVVSERRF